MRAKIAASQSATDVSRRRLLQAAASGLTLLDPGATTAAAATSAAQPRGHFYPDRIPLDEDNDLVIVDFEPADDPRASQLRARFDIVLA